MMLTAQNDNKTPSLHEAWPEHEGFKRNWISDRKMIKSIEYYEAYLEERMRNGTN